MYAKHPDIAKRWSAEYGSRVQKLSKKGLKDTKRATNKA